jgi:pSer/pThr/pTyr-binding forkhead associated (FHA) protein
MYQITLEWSDNDRIRTKTLTADDYTHISQTIIIGRGGEDVCDVVLKHQNPQILNTVSNVHLALFYDPNRNCFFAKNLTQNRQPPKIPNPVIINGKKVITEVVKIEQGTQIKLGKLLLKVKVLDIKKSNNQFVVKCSNPNHPHIIDRQYESLNCPICGYIVFTGTTIKL